MTTRGLVRPVVARRPASNSDMAGRNSPDPTSATAPGMDGSIAAPVRNCRAMTRTQRWTLLAAILGSGIVFLDGTIVNLALPSIGRLPSSFLGVLEGQAYVVNGYLAVLAALLILAGALADYYGRRRIFAIGLAGFGISSLLCGIAPSLELIVLFRVLQGASGALLVPGSLSIITAAFEGAARARAFGTWAAATSGLALFGQPLGGLLVDSLSWRAAFLINVPLVALALWATLRHMQESRDSQAIGQVRLARGDRRGRCDRRPRVRSDPRSAAGVAGLARLDLARRWRRRSRPLPDPDGSATAPPHPDRALPDPRVRGHQPLDIPRLWRVVCRRLLPVRASPGDTRLHGDGGVAVGPADRDPARHPVESGRGGCRPDRPEAIPRGRAAHHGRRALVVGPHPGDVGAVDGVAERPGDARPSPVALRRCAAGPLPVRDRDCSRRRAPDEHPDELHPDPECGHRLGR